MIADISQSPAPSRQLAFSLVEVVLSLGVIAVGVIAILGVFPTALQTGHSAQDETRAPEIAQTIYGSLAAQAPSQFSSVRFLLSDGVTLFPTSPAPSINLTQPPSSVHVVCRQRRSTHQFCNQCELFDHDLHEQFRSRLHRSGECERSNRASGVAGKRARGQSNLPRLRADHFQILAAF